MVFITATLFVLFIACLIAFLLENQKVKKQKNLMKERNRKNKKLVRISNAVFQNIHAYVLVIDKNLKVLRTNYYQRTNRPVDYEDKRVGDLLCCQHAVQSGKCGTHRMCKECKVNKTITQAFAKKQSFPEMEASLILMDEDNKPTCVNAIMSGSYFDIDHEESMVLTIHDITELVSTKHINEKLGNIVAFTCKQIQVGFASLDLITKEEVITSEYCINLNEEPTETAHAIFMNFGNVHPEDREELLDFLNNAATRKVDNLQKTIRVMNGQSVSKWVKILLTQKEYQPKRSINEIYSLSADITKQKESETQLAEAKEKAEEADRSKSAFLANMSHEIRTPLNAIVGFSELLASATSEEEKEQYLEILKMNNEMLLQLINDILDMSKIEAGTLEFKYSDVNINTLMVDLERLFQLRLADNDNLKIIFEPDVPNYILYTDRNRVSQVLSNFISNAIKFTDIGTIRMGYKLYEKGVYFYVSDTGAGIKKELLESVFDRFVRFHKDKKGNGLGLSISKTIIEKLGGTIGVESVYQQGSTFWFILPDNKEHYAAIQVEESKPEEKQENTFLPTASTPVEHADMTNRKPILVADCEKATHDSIAGVEKNYYIMHAKNGEDAIMMFLQEQPKMIFMALEMPEVNGFQALEAIRQMSIDIPVVAIADSEPEDKERIFSSGFAEIITRPLTKELFVDTVNKFFK